MNLDKIKKFIRLANNNPNEHEANLAARRVCKLLAENNFALLESKSAAANRMGAANNRTTGTWEGFERSTEPQWRSNPSYGSATYDHFADFIRNYGQRRSKSWDADTKGNWTDSAPHVHVNDEPEQVKYNPFTSPASEYDPATGERRKRKQELRKCAKCGLEIMTFRIKEDPWVCQQCHWTGK